MWYTRSMTRHVVYTKEALQEAVDNSLSVMDVLEFFGRAKAGGTHFHVSKKIRAFGIDTSHFLGQRSNLGKSPANRRSPSEVLVYLPEDSSRTKTCQLRAAMLSLGCKHSCALCGGGGEWNGASLVLEIDHISGEWLDNRRENLRFLCPNCHSQQGTTNRAWKTRSK